MTAHGYTGRSFVFILCVIRLSVSWKQYTDTKLSWNDDDDVMGDQIITPLITDDHEWVAHRE